MTRSKASRSAAEISSARIDQAARLPRPRVRDKDDFYLIDDPIRPVSDPAVAAARERAIAREKRLARLEVAGHILRSGCEGRPDCSAGHAGHLAYGRELLAELGLVPDPLSKGIRSADGYVKKAFQGDGQ